MTLARSLPHLALSLIWLLGCNRASGCGERPLAELSEARGVVSRDFRARETQWLAAQVGARFSWGDGLRTASGATAQLRVGESGRVMVESDTIIRFLAKPAASEAAPAGLQIAQGSAIIEASDSDLSIQTRNGTALLKSGTRIELRPTPQGDSYRGHDGQRRVLPVRRPSPERSGGPKHGDRHRAGGVRRRLGASQRRRAGRASARAAECRGCRSDRA